MQKIELLTNENYVHAQPSFGEHKRDYFSTSVMKNVLIVRRDKKCLNCQERHNIYFLCFANALLESNTSAAVILMITPGTDITAAEILMITPGLTSLQRSF